MYSDYYDSIGKVAETDKEVADAIFYLTQNKYITAQILGVNGGII